VIFLPFIRILRPAQWLKNFMLLFPPFLGGVIFLPGMLAKGRLPFVSFCLASSTTYIINDILDRDRDRLHPLKKLRPIPSGTVSLPIAAAISIVLLVAACSLAWMISFPFFLLVLAYLVISFSYSLKLKDVPLVDLFCISAGFLIRLLSGGVVFDVPVSEWLFLSVFLLALFLSTGKRLSERNLMGDAAGIHRKTLETYPDGFLDGTMYMTAATVLVTYTMYAITRHFLVYTVPLCTFGLLRYLFLVKSGASGDPTDSLLKDKVLFTVGFLWAVMVGWGIYGR
jgi:decaprenyl-phosphate phosphoribosyltransferase